MQFPRAAEILRPVQVGGWAHWKQVREGPRGWSIISFRGAFSWRRCNINEGRNFISKQDVICPGIVDC